MNLDEGDELGTFIFRTTGFNSIRTLAARLAYYHAASGGLLSCLPLQLTLRGKSTTQSYRLEVNAEEGLDLVEEFYMDDESESEQTQVVSKSKVKQGEGFVQDIQ